MTSYWEQCGPGPSCEGQPGEFGYCVDCSAELDRHHADGFCEECSLVAPAGLVTGAVSAAPTLARVDPPGNDRPDPDSQQRGGAAGEGAAL